MASPQLKQVFEQYKTFAQGAGQAKSPQEMRAVMAAAFSAFPSAGEVKCERLPTVPSSICTAAAT
jgi:hypothetical protein